jgi:putative ABC transport system ATP-binding protein
MTIAETVLEVKDLNHYYGEGPSLLHALTDINLIVRRGEIVILEGPSGSGKTTLLTLIGCLRTVQEGRVELLEQELLRASDDIRTRMRRRIGFIFQAHNLHRSLSARMNVLMGLVARGLPEGELAAQKVDDILTAVGLGGKLDHLPVELSGGQRQRVAVARALVGEPDLVLADEPTAALDKASGRDVVDLMKKLAVERGTTVFLVTHDNRILDIADRLIRMEDGRIVSEVVS